MDGFKRPKPNRPPAAMKPLAVPPARPQPQPTPAEPPIPPKEEESSTRDEALKEVLEVQKPIEPNLGGSKKPELGKKKSSLRKKVVVALVAVLGLVLLTIVGAVIWYNQATQPADASDKSVIRFEVKENASLSAIADELQIRGVIKSSFAFVIYTRLHGGQQGIQAGTCNLSSSESVKDILAKLTEGCHDFRSVTFFPGATIDTSLYAKTLASKQGKDFADTSIRQSLRDAGFSNDEIQAALDAKYDSPVFADRPTGASLEGYIFGETYYVDMDASAKDVLQTAFDHLNTIIMENDLVAKFKAQGLNLYQGITLASIVEKELDCEGKPTEERKQRCYGYQQQIARVFLNRIDLGMSLGSDVTFIYAADRLGVSPSVDVDSPYNTRKYVGLPPGPVATPGELALLSVANPATSDDLFFLAGDDGLIYFAKDEAGHTQNIREHCQEGCGGAV